MAKKNMEKNYIIVYDGMVSSGPWTHKELIKELDTAWGSEDQADQADLEVYELGKKMKLSFQKVRVE